MAVTGSSAFAVTGLFYIFLSASVIYSAKLNVPKVLLPYYSYVLSNFTLEVNVSEESQIQESCYTWRTTNAEVAAIHLLNSTDGECSNFAVVSAVSKTTTKRTAIVLATNRVTGEVLRCIIIVEKITRLQLVTTTRILYLEDSPEVLAIGGYDNEGNKFSSLEGSVFEWSLQSDATASENSIVDANNILRILRFSESTYTTPNHIEPLEDHGLQGDTILVEGISTGSAKVIARIKDSAYKDLPTAEVGIMVVANLIVSPASVYVLKHATVQYTVELLKQNTFIPIKMPSPQYYLEVEDPDICRFDVATSRATGLELGSSDIVLNDRNIKFGESFHQPSATMHVVTPSHLGFVVLPTRKWILEKGRQYEILIEVYDKNSHKLFPANNVIIDSMFPKKYFNVQYSTKNGTYHHVKTMEKGKTEIEGALTKIIKVDGTEHAIVPVIKQMQDVEIYDPIQVLPSILYFPWDPETQFSHTYKLKATGGSGDYVWNSNNATVVSINIKGQITTSALGASNITAADARNQGHFSLCQVHVLPPVEMNFLPSPVEAEIDYHLVLPLAVFARYKGTLVEFADCRKLILRVTFSDNSVFQLINETGTLKDGSCTSFKVKALHPGHTEVRVQYEYGGTVLQAVVTIAAYRPLVPLDPELVAVVAVGSSRNVVFDGGPLPWILDQSKYFETLSVENQNVLSLIHRHIPGLQGGQHVFNLLCKEFGEQVLSLSVGNEKTYKNEFPATSSAAVRYACAIPVGLHIHPLIEQVDPSLPPCPIRQDAEQAVPVLSTDDLIIVVTVTDNKGRKFDNFTSLQLEWKISDHSLISISGIDQLSMENELFQHGQEVTAYQRFITTGKQGTTVITASIRQYDSQLFSANGIKVQTRLQTVISKSLQLMFVKRPDIRPDTMSVFNHPSNKVPLEVHGGSGYFHVVGDKTAIIQSSYIPKSRTIEILPKADGNMTITAYDLCLALKTHPTAYIHVSGVHIVELSVLDKVEVGRDISAHVKVLDASRRPLASQFFSLMNLEMEVGSNIISVRPKNVIDIDKYTSIYTVHGSVVGHTHLSCGAHLDSSRTVTSKTMSIEVFPPLKLSYRNLTLIIGAVFQILSIGGPRHKTSVEYNILDSDIATVSSSGLLKAAHLGTTTVVGRAVGTDAVTMKQVVYSQDIITVNVVLLTGIRIHIPLRRIRTNTQMAIYAVGENEFETPFTFGSSTPALKFSWSISNEEVAILRSVYHKSSVYPDEASNFAQQLVANKAGHVTIRLKVVSESGREYQILDHRTLTDEVQIQVFEELSLLNPPVCNGRLLITPNTETQLKTNREGSAIVVYSIIHAEDNSVVSLHDHGQLVSASATGNAAVLVTSQEDFGLNQSLVILIQVKQVSYLMMNADTVLHTAGVTLPTVPVGTTLHFTISYHDDEGTEFYATNIRIQVRCNRYDLIQVSRGSENNTLIIKAAHVGQTVIRVSDKSDPRLSDYLHLPVGNAIQPMGTQLMLGDIICFSTPIVTAKGLHGQWFTASNAISIDDRRGFATALSVGKATVTYTISDAVNTLIDVTVKPIQKITLSQNIRYLTNNPSRSKNFLVYVQLGSTTSSVVGDNCTAMINEHIYVSHIVPIHCSLELHTSKSDIFSIHDIFRTSATFDANSGRYLCQITPITNEHLAQQISGLVLSVSLEVTVPGRDQQPEVQATPLSFDFIPMFYVQTNEVYLTPAAPVYHVRVSTVSQLHSHIQVDVSDSRLLEALTPEVDAHSVLLIPIRLINAHTIVDAPKVDYSLELVCEITGQRILIPVKLGGDKKEYSEPPPVFGWTTFWSAASSSSHYLLIFVMIAVTTIAIVLGYHFLIGPRYQLNPNTSVMLPPGSPVYAAYGPALGSPPTVQSPLWSTGYSPQEAKAQLYRRSSPYNRPSP